MYSAYNPQGQEESKDEAPLSDLHSNKNNLQLAPEWQRAKPDSHAAPLNSDLPS